MPLRIIQVGMGGFGSSWAASVIPQVKAVELVAAVDVSSAALERARTYTSLPAEQCFLSLDEALERTEADAVLVTTPLVFHIPYALAALEAGKHVLVEKPFAPTLDDAQRAVDAAAEKGLVLMVSQNYRFQPAVRAVQELVAGNSLGQLNAVYLDFRRYDNSAPRGNHVHYHVPQPMLVDMAIHHFDLMRLVLGREPREIYCHSWNPPWSKYDEPPAAMAIVKFDGDVIVSYRGSWLSPGKPTPWGGEWRMEFAETEVAWTSRGGGAAPDSDDAVSIRLLGEEPQPLPMPQMRYLDRTGVLEKFVHAVRTGEEPETSGRNNIPTLALTLASVESAATGLPVLL